MGEEPFRFLSREEFDRLSPMEMAHYLSRAVRELAALTEAYRERAAQREEPAPPPGTQPVRTAPLLD